MSVVFARIGIPFRAVAIGWNGVLGPANGFPVEYHPDRYFFWQCQLPIASRFPLQCGFPTRQCRFPMRGLRFPIQIRDKEHVTQNTIATIGMYVDLPKEFKGTHMSRFIEVLNAHGNMVHVENITDILHAMQRKLHADTAHLEMEFPFFLEKTVRAIWIEDLIALVEGAASSELYSLLKRQDEKAVTERAYENPVFVEDLVRNVALRLNAHSDVTWYKVEAENYESIHNHNAYACIEKG
jgi:GTP cyclohydrolase IB